MSPWNQRPVDQWPSSPYPGERPDCSWRPVGDVVHRVVPIDSGWLDVATGNVFDLADRIFILAYGSNANPNKLRQNNLHGMDVVMLQTEITDARAVWCNGRRRRDHSVVATLVETPGHVEACPVVALRPEDVAAVDGWEMPAYHRRPFWGQCTLENGASIDTQVYVGGPNRQPLLSRGEYVPLHEVEHAVIDRMVP